MIRFVLITVLILIIDMKCDDDVVHKQFKLKSDGKSYVNDRNDNFHDNLRSDDSRHFLRRKFLMLKNFWDNRKGSNSTEVVSNIQSLPQATNYNLSSIPTFTAILTLPASDSDDYESTNPVLIEKEENINTGTPTGTATGTGTITAQPADFVPGDLSDDEIIPLKNINNSSNHIQITSYGALAKSKNDISTKRENQELVEIIEENNFENNAAADEDYSNNYENDDNYNIKVQETSDFQMQQYNKQKMLQKQFIQQEIQEQLYQLRQQQEEKKKRKKKKKNKPNSGIAYYAKYLPENLRKLIQNRPNIASRTSDKIEKEENLVSRSVNGHLRKNPIVKINGQTFLVLTV